MNTFNDYLAALTCLLAAILVINILNPEVRYGLLRFFTGDYTDAIEEALRTKKFPTQFQYKTVTFSGDLVSAVWRATLSKSEHKDIVVIRIGDDRIAEWIHSIYKFPAWLGSRRIRLGRCFYEVVRAERKDDGLYMHVLHKKLNPMFRFYVAIQILAIVGMFGILIYAAFKHQNPEFFEPVIYGSFILMALSYLSLHIKGSSK
ncbi:hypothetical protein JA33_253 [Dickeya phage vB_DsoM_JA33]|uniref:Uncharacterized protein n=2 Tax=Salmondvirus JA11 TaxID=2734141 RepID=A0A386K7G3_9CAUD|nr:hypothetical protein HOU32_gp252 [Dickeya phage vB_DsoM_JA11]AXG67627.1 hypothetical protein JA33_253 [Dickeya phage vB_DsoM_JA33]AYD80057.1 hypothetical protein JA11_252 [Dickeya phage vB_DsoM_JA11]